MDVLRLYNETAGPFCLFTRAQIHTHTSKADSQQKPILSKSEKEGGWIHFVCWGSNNTVFVFSI